MSTSEMNWIKQHESSLSKLKGKVIVITGANSGIGKEATRVLASFGGATIILACRSADKANQAIKELTEDATFKIPSDNLVFLQLDLSDLNSIQAFSQSLSEKYPIVDMLICNAGIMALNTRQETSQGFEAQYGTNVIGHYALAAQVVPFLLKAENPRIIWVSSGAHKTVSGIDLTRPATKYSKWQIYGETKLGNLLLMHKFSQLYPTILNLGCHPGLTNTNLQNGTVFRGITNWIGMSALKGSLPTVLAAIDENAKPNGYYGPSMSIFGLPVRDASMTKYAKDLKLADRVFEDCKAKTKV